MSSNFALDEVFSILPFLGENLKKSTGRTGSLSQCCEVPPHKSKVFTKIIVSVALVSLGIKESFKNSDIGLC